MIQPLAFWVSILSLCDWNTCSQWLMKFCNSTNANHCHMTRKEIIESELIALTKESILPQLIVQDRSYQLHFPKGHFLWWDRRCKGPVSLSWAIHSKSRRNSLLLPQFLPMDWKEPVASHCVKMASCLNVPASLWELRNSQQVFH